MLTSISDRNSASRLNWIDDHLETVRLALMVSGIRVLVTDCLSTFTE